MQNEYNTHKNQMARFQDAGLNPHLVYGQGSPGNQNQALTYPGIQPVDFSKLMQMVPLINQTRLTDAQVQATNAKTRQTTVLTELNKLQARVVAANPLLDNEGFKATIDSLKSSAEIKASQSDMERQRADWSTKKIVIDDSLGYYKGTNGDKKMDEELNLLEQRFHLGQLDARIKAEVVQSKDFQNAILEVQKRFMTDYEITPQHILQFTQLLLMKMLK